jgi:hypothetical protein
MVDHQHGRVRDVSFVGTSLVMMTPLAREKQPRRLALLGNRLVRPVDLPVLARAIPDEEEDSAGTASSRPLRLRAIDPTASVLQRIRLLHAWGAAHPEQRDTPAERVEVVGRRPPRFRRVLLTSGVLLLCLAAALAAIAIVAALRLPAASLARLERSIPTTARVLAVHEDDNTWSVRVQPTAPHPSSAPRSIEMDEAPQVGEVLDVHFDPEDPAVMWRTGDLPSHTTLWDGTKMLAGGWTFMLLWPGTALVLHARPNLPDGVSLFRPERDVVDRPRGVRRLLTRQRSAA